MTALHQLAAGAGTGTDRAAGEQPGPVLSVRRLAISFGLDEMSPAGPAKRVMVPTFLCQVRDDVLTRSSDVQSIFDNIPIREKELLWIEGTTKRWDGYTRFAKEPGPMLAWFERYIFGP